MASWTFAPWTFAGPAAAIRLRITPKDTFPPKPITDLDAALSSNEGELLLQWTAPAEDDVPLPSANPVSLYLIRTATFSVTSLAGDSTSWWNLAAPYPTSGLAPQAPPNLDSALLTGLEPGATLYFAIRSQDDSSNISLIDLNAQTGPQAQAQVPDRAPPVVTGLSATVSSDTVTLSWSASTATDVTGYRVYWDTAAPADAFTATATVAAPALSLTLTGLDLNNTYFFTVTALDKGEPAFLGDVLESTPSAVAGALISGTPSAPSNFGAASIATNSITWRWTDTESGETEFRIYSTTGGLVGTSSALPGTGSVGSFLEAGLSPNTAYARFVRSVNGVGESLSSNTTDRFTLANPPSGSAVQGVAVASATLAWSANNNPSGTAYLIQRARDSSFATVEATATTTNLTYTDTGLSANTTYFWRLRASNAEGAATAFDQAVSTTTPFSPILGLKATAGNRRVALDWDDATQPDLAGYHVYRSTLSAGPFERLTASAFTTSYYLDEGLTNGVTYYYGVTILSSGAVEGPLSEIVSARPKKTAAPREPTGVSGSLDSQGAFTLSWSPVVQDVEGSTATELAGYRIYKSSEMEGPYILRDSVPPSTNFWVSPDRVPPAVWYLIRAFDLGDSESADSMSVEASAAPSMAVASDDGTAHMVFPREESKVFNGGTNGRSEDLRMTVNRRANEEQDAVLTSYEIRTFGAVSGTEVKDMVFPRPNVRLEFRYHPGLRGAPYLSPRATLRTFKGSIRDVGIFWHNKVEFVKFGGQVDEFRGTVSLKTARPLGRFQVRQVLRATEFMLSQMTPRKIFTPNGDGVNDEIILFFENPRDSVVTQAKIYDLTGAEVADMEQGIVAGSFGLVSLKWNGKDKEGRTARSGVYVYQVQCEGKTLNGTIVVAR